VSMRRQECLLQCVMMGSVYCDVGLVVGGCVGGGNFGV
jgi:hypothetical protein